jgi:hypothetical protein
MALLLTFYVAAGLLLAGLSLPLIWRKVSPNPWYGFRVRQTVDDPAVWYPANAYAGKGLLGVGLSTCAAAIALFFVPGISLDWYAGLVAVVAFGGLAVTVVLSFRYLGQLVGGATREGPARREP